MPKLPIRGLDEAVKGAAKGAAKGSSTTYGKISREAAAQSRTFFKRGPEGSEVYGGAGLDMTKTEKLSMGARWVGGNWQDAAMKEGRTVLGMAGSHALRGAGVGAVIGGTTSAVQGGSFWDGAKQGAFNGAVGWAGYRMAMKGVGASSLNPFAGGNKGLFSAGNTMWRSMNNDAQISKAAVNILNNRQGAGLARAYMNAAKKSK